jgi:hypothetical protein
VDHHETHHEIGHQFDHKLANQFNLNGQFDALNL